MRVDTSNLNYLGFNYSRIYNGKPLINSITHAPTPVNNLRIAIDHPRYEHFSIQMGINEGEWEALSTKHNARREH